jgi:hypothetical protein
MCGGSTGVPIETWFIIWSFLLRPRLCFYRRWRLSSSHLFSSHDAWVLPLMVSLFFQLGVLEEEFWSLGTSKQSSWIQFWLENSWSLSFFLKAMRPLSGSNRSPQDEPNKIRFLEEIRSARNICVGPWAVMGDCNLILEEKDKNNRNLNRWMMRKFEKSVHDLMLNNIHLNGHAFTWTDDQQNSALTRIDRVMGSVKWHLPPRLLFTGPWSTTSDHCPLLLSTVLDGIKWKRFRLKSFWINKEGFMEIVEGLWNNGNQDKFVILLPTSTTKSILFYSIIY